MNTTIILAAVILFLILLQAVSFFIMYRLVRHLSDKIAIPVLNQSTRKVEIVRPTPETTKAPEVAEEDKNMPDREESPYRELSEVPDEELYAAVAKAGSEK